MQAFQGFHRFLQARKTVEIDAPILVQERHRYAVSTALDEQLPALKVFGDSSGRLSPTAMSAQLSTVEVSRLGSYRLITDWK